MAMTTMAFVSTKGISTMVLPSIGMVGQPEMQLLLLLREMQRPKLRMLQKLPKQIRKQQQMAPLAGAVVAVCQELIRRRHRHRRLPIRPIAGADTTQHMQRRAEWHPVGSQWDAMVTEFQLTQLVGEHNQILHLGLGFGVSLVLQLKVGPLEVTPAQRGLVILCKSES